MKDHDLLLLLLLQDRNLLLLLLLRKALRKVRLALFCVVHIA